MYKGLRGDVTKSVSEDGNKQNATCRWEYKVTQTSLENS